MASKKEIEAEIAELRARIALLEKRLQMIHEKPTDAVGKVWVGNIDGFRSRWINAHGITTSGVSPIDVDTDLYPHAKSVISSR